MDNAKAVRARAIAYLARVQNRDGGFSSITSSDPSFQIYDVRATTFFTSLVLNALNQACAREDMHSVGTIRRRAAMFLVKQKSADWSFNYWSRTSIEMRTMPYPDDLDDTALAIRALHGYDPSLVPPVALAAVAQLLIAGETQEGGPYRTWCVPESSSTFGADLDVAVNANIRTLMNGLGVTLPGLDAYLFDALERNKLSSPYYPIHYSLFYFLSQGIGTSPGGERLRTLSRVRMGDRVPPVSQPLDRMLFLMARIRFDIPSDMPKSHVVGFLRNVSYEAHAFGVERIVLGVRHMSACPAFSAALIIELCTLLLNHDGPSGGVGKETDAFVVRVRKSISKPTSEFEKKVGDLLNDVSAKAQHDEAIALPFLIYRSIKKPAVISLHELVRCARAGWRGWVGYTHYDDAVDDAVTHHLPAAHHLMRTSYQAYMDMGRSLKNGECEKFEHLVGIVFSDMDEAMDWELRHCRIPKFGVHAMPQYGAYHVLANRSMGHALGAVSVLVLQTRCRVDGPEVKSMLKFFHHTIIARQLNDDAHDWVADLRAGSVNSIAALLMKMAGKKTIQPEKDIPALQELFWKSGMRRTARIITSHAAQARKALLPLKRVMDTAFLEAMVKKVEDGAKNALKERADMLQFSAEFNKESPAI